MKGNRRQPPGSTMETYSQASLFYLQCFTVLIRVRSQSTGLSLSLKGRTIPNHGLVYIDDIGETEQDSLQCRTTLEACCENNLGHWNYPHYGQVKSRDNSEEDVLFSSRGRQTVRIHRKNMPVKIEGIMRCEIPDAQTRDSVLYVGIYNINKGLPEIYSVQVDRVMMSINCFSKGGPVTEFSWFKDGAVIPLQSGSAYSQSKVIIDFGTSNYLISLRSNSESNLIGSFKCAVNNSAGSHERTVVVDSDFSVSLVKGCGALPNLENGMLQLSNEFKIGSQVTFMCSASYKVFNLRDVRCLDNGMVGQWSGGNLPACERTENCISGFEGTSGLLTQYTDRFKEFSVASFSCENTHRMIGTGNPVSCRNGKWDGSAPQCELVICPVLSSIRNGNIVITNSRMVGATATYSCSSPYTLSSTNSVRRCLKSGVWTGSAMQCIAALSVKSDTVCEPLPTDGKVKAMYGNSQVILSCPKGYTLVGSKFAKCDHKTKQWSGNRNPTCKEISAGTMVSYDEFSLFCAILWVFKI